ncbi:MAG: recombinase RecT [Elusimicrobia bacterium]|nr:recombinase RecT [Elusimicrobiota bacterium]
MSAPTAPPQQQQKSGAIAKNTPIQTLAAYINARKDQLSAVLPKHMTAERIVKIAIAAAARTPALLQCSPESVYLALAQAAQLGLEAGSPLGGAYLVPYKQTCTLIVGYRGLIDLARRSGQILSIEAHIVHQKDKFELSFGLEPRLVHVPYLDGDPGSMKLVYAVAKLRDGGTQAEVMSRTDVDAIRSRSKAGGHGPWVTDYEEMAKKTVVRRLAKYLPLTIELADAVTHQEETDDGRALHAIEVVEMPPQQPELPEAQPATKAADVAQELKRRKGAAAEPGMRVVHETKGMRMEVEDDPSDPRFAPPDDVFGDEPPREPGQEG